MLFASLDFLLFVLPVLFGYWALAQRPRTRWILLLAASYFFYCASSRPVSGALPTRWTFVGLLIGSTVLDYFLGLLISAAQRSPLIRRAALATSLIGNLGLLGYFKYSGFLLDAANDIAAWVGVDAALPTLRTALPIGISFYTFQSLSYTIDVYRGCMPAERNLLRFALFVAFFPQLVAGPIVRAAEFLPQLRARLRVEVDDVDFAVFRITRGLVKKVVLGDFIAAQFTDVVFSAPNDYSSLENLIALYAFTLQIYADFSGYSDIAIGVARLFGFRLPENFDRPYQARDVGEFWRRWHMTLSTWLRDYLFFPLGGSLGSEARTYFNLWLTMFLVGMWHGASWNFVIYGSLQATAMVYSRFNRLRTQNGRRVFGFEVVGVAVLLGVLGLGLGRGVLGLEWSSGALFAAFVFGFSLLNSVLPAASSSRLWAIVHVFLLFHFTTLSRVFFRADDLERAGQIVGKLVEWDFLGVRDGLFRVQWAYDWVEAQQRGLGTAGGVLLGMAHWGLLLLLLFGLGIHFTPARWSNRGGLELVRRLPAPALGLLLAGVAFVIAQLLAGPRANIYFSF